ncbi:hypothetical protein ACWEOW_01575 [Monashia sp. NPDC004114]
MDQLEGTGAPAHEAFVAHFTDPIYDDPAEEFAPFGSDEGADILSEWVERADDLDDRSTVRFVLQDWFEDSEDLQAFLHDLELAAEGTSGSSAEGAQTPGPRIPEPGGDVDGATIVLGAGFTLLRLTGHIDSEGRRLVLAALRVLESFYGPQREFDVMRRDVEAFA